MATLVGTQTEFKDLIRELAELDYDAVEAYEVAIRRLDNTDYIEQLISFKNDHERHIQELNALLKSHKYEEVKGPSSKQWLTKGKVVISDMVGNDKAILKAMITNEMDTNKAYERANRHDSKWKESVSVLQKALADEKRHKSWMERNV